ncbi:MAG: glycerol-3-phosphate dehydrogenase [Candidatus Omnitrophica bacterium CG1_02_49_10]|nr:MAG: glycerol-3-phosphate dehydrogenase [Candidatus Omnitrophica bacterium CG1_02_49_10]
MALDNNKIIAVIGDGGWGTTLSILLKEKGFDVRLWSPFEGYAKTLASKRVNEKFLPGIDIPEDMTISHDLEKVLEGACFIILAVPSSYMRSVIEEAAKSAPDGIFVSVSKGIENGSLKRMSEVVEEVCGRVKLGVLSGPSIAHEVARKMPTTVVASSRDKEIAHAIQDIFISETFRVYTSGDTVGVELGGALKNVIAIAAGISDGLGFGVNSKAGLLTRGLVEIVRLGAAMGAQEKTFYGLSGLGDLATTCVSEHSRNRHFGFEIGKGRKKDVVLKDSEMVVEGVATTRSAYDLAKKYKVDMPITEKIYEILFKDKDPREAVVELMCRERKKE